MKKKKITILYQSSLDSEFDRVEYNPGQEMIRYKDSKHNQVLAKEINKHLAEIEHLRNSISKLKKAMEVLKSR